MITCKKTLTFTTQKADVIDNYMHTKEGWTNYMYKNKGQLLHELTPDCQYCSNYISVCSIHNTATQASLLCHNTCINNELNGLRSKSTTTAHLIFYPVAKELLSETVAYIHPESH